MFTLWRLRVSPTGGAVRIRARLVELEPIGPAGIVVEVTGEVLASGVGKSAVRGLDLRKLDHEGHVTVAVKAVEAPPLVPFEEREVAQQAVAVGIEMSIGGF